MARLFREENRKFSTFLRMLEPLRKTMRKTDDLMRKKHSKSSIPLHVLTSVKKLFD